MFIVQCWEMNDTVPPLNRSLMKSETSLILEIIHFHILKFSSKLKLKSQNSVEFKFQINISTTGFGIHEDCN